MIVVLYLGLSLFVFGQAENIEETFIRHKVVKDVVGLAPPKLLKVAFDSGKEAYLGNILTPSDVRNQPIELYWPTRPDSLYTLIMTGEN
uniref:Phosphatidylethanolamine-binding protein n=1 Tax=Panagrolaimus sp. JU765 TaxID=591449 RepID=A0AC34PUC5_9BILA